MSHLSSKSQMVSAMQALAGRSEAIQVSDLHFVNGHQIAPPFPDHLKTAVFALGCFWGAERKFWQVSGVYSTAVGYSGGFTPNPNYAEVCSGMTGHAEVVLVVYDPKQVSYGALLKVFWEVHNPTQGMRQGGDIGTQYRSAIYVNDKEQRVLAESSSEQYQKLLKENGHAAITTEIQMVTGFYYAEEYHQQYLAKNPQGYCGLGGTGVSCHF